MYQRDKFNAARDKFSYPKIPNATLFYKDYGYQEPATVHGWDWSTTSGQWGALVTFKDGLRTFTWPKPPSAPKQRGFQRPFNY